jgi:hypothetical protein
MKDSPTYTLKRNSGCGELANEVIVGEEEEEP